MFKYFYVIYKNHEILVRYHFLVRISSVLPLLKIFIDFFWESPAFFVALYSTDPPGENTLIL